MTPLPTTPGGFRVICADVPWGFKSNSKARPGRNAMRHYDTMTLDEIKSLPVADIAAPDCALFFWVTGPFLAIGAHLPIMKAWGFKPSGMGFDWIKLLKNADDFHTISIRGIENFLHMGGGFTTRKNAEYVVIGKRGKSVRRNAGVRSTIISPLREHSRKPDEFYQRVETYSEGPYCELFGRESRPGWSVWGNEATKFDEPDAASVNGEKLQPGDWIEVTADLDGDGGFIEHGPRIIRASEVGASRFALMELGMAA